MRLAFFFDQSRCMSCNTCSVACKDYYQVNPGPVRYRKQAVAETENGFFPLSIACNHCQTPACQAACGAGAITKRSNGIVVVDRNRCQSLKACITACPFAEPGLADDRQEPLRGEKWSVRHPMQKCSMCEELQNKDELPVCVRACPAHALAVGDYDEILGTYPGAVPLSPGTFPYAYVSDGAVDTGPSFLIRPKKSLAVSK